MPNAPSNCVQTFSEMVIIPPTAIMIKKQNLLEYLFLLLRNFTKKSALITISITVAAISIIDAIIITSPSKTSSILLEQSQPFLGLSVKSFRYPK